MRSAAFLSIFLFVSGAGNQAASPEGSPLGFPASWDRAVTRWSSGLSWKPGRMTIRSEEIGKDGKIVSVEETFLVLRYPSGPDNPVSEITKATKDGQDVTDDRRAQAAKRGASGGRGGPPPGLDFPDPIPFAPAAAGKTSVSPPRPLPFGIEELGYRIEGKTTVVGTVRFLSGQPLSIAYSLEPLPFYLKSFSGTTTFASAPDGSLVSRELAFDADVNFLVMKKHYRFSLAFGEWTTVTKAAMAINNQ